jgi:hypothetical protein
VLKIISFICASVSISLLVLVLVTPLLRKKNQYIVDALEYIKKRHETEAMVRALYPEASSHEQNRFNRYSKDSITARPFFSEDITAMKKQIREQKPKLFSSGIALKYIALGLAIDKSPELCLIMGVLSVVFYFQK